MPRSVTIAGVALLVASARPLHLTVDEQTVLVSVPVCDRAAFTRVVDLCCGLGGFSVTVDRLGFKVFAGVGQNGLWRKLFGSGIDCRPHSVLGDRKEMQDPWA